jgi:hypothetical protein
MNRREFFRFGAPVVTAPLLLHRTATAQAPTQSVPSGASTLPPPGVDGWVSLFNGRNLDGWYTFLQMSGRDAAQARGMVTVEEGLLHIMGNQATAQNAESGYLATNQEFENVRIRVEYKWGTKRFAPRLENKRDNGLLYHLVGRDVVWPTCVECQIQETDVGDYFMLGGTRAVQGNLPGNGGAGFITLINTANRGAGAGAGPAPGAAAAVPGAGAPTGGRGGGAAAVEPTGGRKLKDGDFERLDDWNVVEVIAQGDRSTHVVNGRIVNLVSRIQQPDPQNAGQFIPLARGKIAIEIEYAECWFRRIEVKKIG